MTAGTTNTRNEMQGIYDYKKFAILYVDDEEKSLKYFARAFEDQFRILTASSARAGLELLEQHKDEVGVLMTDQRMPGERGTWLLEKARQLRPRVIRILATAFSEMDAAVAAVNTGAIYKYVSKPWDPPQLESTLKRALEFFLVQRERDQLMTEKLSVLHNMMIADRIVSLGLLAAGLSHHIRNSLVAVKTFLDLAPSKLEEENLTVDSMKNPECWKEYYRNVQGQIEKINNLLKDLWTATEAPACAFSDTVRLQELIPEVVEELSDGFAAKSIHVDCQLSADLPALSADEPKFRRLFELLLKDEMVSLPTGSQITVRAEPAEEPSGEPGLEVTVVDDGPGLPEEALRLVFDPFVVRSDTPLEYGINLMACFFIVHHHGGRIAACGGEGQGTVFTLRFPLAPRVVAAQESADFLEKVMLNDRLWEKLLTTV